MTATIEAVGDHTAKHDGKLLKNKKFLMIAGGVAVLGVVVYFRKKNATPAADTAAFSNYPTPPQDTGSVPSNIGSSTGTYDPTSATNDPYSTDLGNTTAPLMTPQMYQSPVENVPQQQAQDRGVINKSGVAPGGFEVVLGDTYTQQGNTVKVTDTMGGIGTYDTQSHNYTWDNSAQQAPGVGYTPPSGTTANFRSILKLDGSVVTPQSVGADNNTIGSDGLTDYARASKQALLANGGTNYQNVQPSTVSHSAKDKTPVKPATPTTKAGSSWSNPSTGANGFTSKVH